MKILRINTFDRGGGAERVAWTLFDAERQLGHTSRLVVSEKRSTDPDVLELLKPPQPGALGRWLLRLLDRINPRATPGSGRLHYTSLRRGLKRLLGIEIFDFPLTYRIFERAGMRPDLLHCHNLHRHDGGFFDLRALPWFSRQLPVVITLHDAWLLSGHCAHSFDCLRWQTGCGHCPDLNIYPPIKRDASAYNWKAKRSIYQRSRLYVVTPSQWLMDKVQRSILQPGILEGRVIPDGINLELFHPPQDKIALRASLGLPANDLVLFCSASGIRSNPFKDFPMLQRAFSQLASQRGPGDSPLLCLALGESGPSETIGSSELRFIPFQKDPAHVAQYYQAADIYLHAARADTFPNTILEALACGLPVVATAVGGIPEQIQESRTGFLTPPSDAPAFAQQIARLIDDPGLRQEMGIRAAQQACQRYDQQLMIQRYLGWFQEILSPTR